MKNQEVGDEPLFVGVPNPKLVRKEILTSVKTVINDLQRYEQLAAPKNEKVQFWFELKRVMQEIVVLNRKLKDMMPVSAKKPRSAMEASAPSAARMSAEGIAESRLDSERGKLRALEDQLARVEEKLDTL